MPDNSLPPLPAGSLGYQPPPIDAANLSGPLSETNLRELAAAKTRLGKLRRAVAVANFDGWSLCIFGGLTFILGLGSITTMAIGMFLVAAGFIELQSARQLKRLEISAVHKLFYIASALALLVVVYCLWMIHGELTGSGAFDELAQAAEVDMDQFRRMVVTVYTLVMTGGLLYFGALAMYFRTREKHLQAYLTETPKWITQMQQAGVTI